VEQRGGVIVTSGRRWLLTDRALSGDSQTP